jgi:hypothetical protein
LRRAYPSIRGTQVRLSQLARHLFAKSNPAATLAFVAYLRKHVNHLV